MGNSNSNDANRNKSSMLKSPRKIFSKNKKPNKNLFYFNKGRHLSTEVDLVRGQGQEIVEPYTIEFMENEGDDTNKNKRLEQVELAWKEENMSLSDLISLYDGGARIIGNTEEDQSLKNTIKCQYSESEYVGGSVRSVYECVENVSNVPFVIEVGVCNEQSLLNSQKNRVKYSKNVEKKRKKRKTVLNFTM